MTKVLIADAIKPSLVMSSEVFKDKITGCTVIIARTGLEAIQLAEQEKPDLCLVDFDLPDVDGPALVLALRKIYSGPILMTAYPDKTVEQAVEDHLFAHNDASAWIRKPIKFDELSAQIDVFLIEQNRTGKRFDMEIPMQVVAKAAGRGKRAPKSGGLITNLSLGGACIQLDTSLKMQKEQELTLSLSMATTSKAKKPAEKLTVKTKAKTSTRKSPDTKIKATVAWITKDGQVGLRFSKLTDSQQKGIEDFLKLESSP